MRMWDVPPHVMCRKHLLGEHLELHMFVGAMNKGTSLQGFIDNGLLDISKLASRHEELVAEMTRRGYKHKSPLPQVPINGWEVKAIDTEANLLELSYRCFECEQLQKEYPREVCLYPE